MAGEKRMLNGLDDLGITVLKQLTNIVVINTAQDFIDAATTYAGGVITIPSGAYHLGAHVDLAGDRIVFGGDCCILGSGEAHTSLTSTGLAGDLVTATDVGCGIASTALSCPSGTVLNISDTTGTKELVIHRTRIHTCNRVMTLGEMHDIHIDTLVHFNNWNEGIVRTAEVRHIHMSDAFIIHSRNSGSGPTTFLDCQSYKAEKLDVANCTFESDQSGDIAIDVSSVVDPTTFGEASIESSHFEGYDVIPLIGADASTTNWRIPFDANDGLAGAYIDVDSSIKSSWSTTSTTFLEITDPTAPGESPVFIGEISSYNPDASTIKARFDVTVGHDQSGQDVVIEMYNTTNNLVMGFGGLAKLDVDTIAWQSGNTIRYTFNTTPDLSRARVGDKMIIESATNASNDGVFEITDVNDGADWIEITNPNRTDATDDEATDSPATTYGGGVVWKTITTGGVDELISTEDFILDENKSYTCRVRRGSSSGGNPDVYIEHGQQITIIF